MPIKLYFLPFSPPARAVNLTVHALGLKVEYIIIRTLNNEHLTPEYLKINPQHTVPTLIDEDGFSLWDSHAINQYLVSKYGQVDDPLYPRDLQKRALIDQRLHYHNDLHFVLRKITRPVMRQNKKFVTDEDTEETKRVMYDVVEMYLDSHDWIVGDTMTIADFHYISTIASIVHYVPPGDGYPRMMAWMKRCAATMKNYEEANGSGADGLGKFIVQKLFENNKLE